MTENSESSSGSSSQAATDTDPCWNSSERVGSAVVCKKKQKGKARSSSKRRDQRFSLLSKKKENSEGEPESKLDVTTSLIEAAVKAEDPLRGLLALQLAQVAKPRKKKGKKSRDRRRSRSTDSSRSPSSGTSDSGSSSADSKERRLRQSAKGYHASGKKMFRHPIRYIKRYVRQVEMELGRKDVHSS